MAQIRAAIFDAYGTLLDVHAAMGLHAVRIGSNWQAISTDWRNKQLEYSWVRSLAGPAQHRDFWALTQEALAWVAAKHGIQDAAILTDILNAYRHLQAYAEVPAMLRTLQDRGVARVILSNGEPGMLADAVQSAGIAGLLDDVLSAETVGVFKPDPRIYRLCTERFGLPPEEMAFLSSNPWDAYGAREFGFQVFWVNRTNQPDEYGLRDSVRVIPNLLALPDAFRD